MRRILLVRTNYETSIRFQHPVNYRPPYTLKYIQALLRKKENFYVCFIDALAQSLSLRSLLNLTFNFNPETIIIASTHLDIIFTMNYISMLKKKLDGITIIVLGAGPSSIPELYYQNSAIDFILPGESELEVCSILEKINAGVDIKNLRRYYDRIEKNKVFIVPDVNILPFIDYTREEIFRYRMIYPLRINRRLQWGHILSSRGCPYNCLFCSSLLRDSYGKQLRLRDAKNVIDEIEYQLSLGINIVSFDDVNFTTAREHVFAICNEILKRKVKFYWIVHARIDNLDREMISIMKETGCRMLRIGVESGSQRIIQILRKTSIPDWAEKAKNIFSICRDLKMDTVALFLVGSPTETKEELHQSLKLAKQLQPNIIQVSFFTPSPGSLAYKENKFSFDASILNQIHHYNRNRITNLSALDNGDLVKIYKAFYMSFLSNPGFIIQHIFKYFRFYLYNINTFLQLLKIHPYLKRFNDLKQKSRNNQN